MPTQKQQPQLSQPQLQPQPKLQPHYTLILRLPFPRPEGFPQNEQSSQHQHQHQQQQHKPVEAHHYPELQQQRQQNTPPRDPNNLYDPQTPPRHASASTATVPGPSSAAPTPESAAGGTPQNVTTTAGTSEGTPSMGSSFSDLSVAQSALEEALMSADGGFGSRVSTLGR
jgi:hypothetical protein